MRNYPVYREVEIRHPEYPADAEPLIAEVQRNLTNRQLEALPRAGTNPEPTMKEVRDSVAQYVKSWNFTAETESGAYEPVPAPMDGGGDVFKLMDDYFLFELYAHVRYANYGGPPGSKGEDERKNSSAASESSPDEPGAATHAIVSPSSKATEPTPIRTPSTDSASTSTPRKSTTKAASAKKKTIPSVTA